MYLLALHFVKSIQPLRAPHGKEIIKEPKKVKKGTGGCGEICKWAFTGNVVVRAEA